MFIVLFIVYLLSKIYMPKAQGLWLFVPWFFWVPDMQKVIINICWLDTPKCIHFYWSIFFSFLNCYSFTVVCIFSPSLHPAPGEPTSLPCLHPPPWFCPCVLYSSSCKPLSPLSPPHSPLAIVRLFLTSTSLVMFCFLFSFVDYVEWTLSTLF